MKKTIYTCDRCGKDKIGHIGVDVTLHNGDEPIREVGWITLQSKTGYQKSLDLCEDCMKELAGWLGEISQKMQPL